MTIALPADLVGNPKNKLEHSKDPKVVEPSDDDKKPTPEDITMEYKDQQIKNQQAVIDNLRANFRISNAKKSNLENEKKEIEKSHQKTVCIMISAVNLIKKGIRVDDVIDLDILVPKTTEKELSNAKELVSKQEKELQESKTAISELTDKIDVLEDKNNMMAIKCSSIYRFLQEKKEDMERIHKNYQSNFGKTDEYELKFRNQEASLLTIQKKLARKNSEVERLQKKVSEEHNDLRGAEEALQIEMKTACKREKDLMEKIRKLEKNLGLEEVEYGCYQ